MALKLCSGLLHLVILVGRALGPRSEVGLLEVGLLGMGLLEIGLLQVGLLKVG